MPTDASLIPGATSTLRARLYAKIIRGKRDECWRWKGKTCKHRGGVRGAIRVGPRGRIINVCRVLLVLKDRVPLALRDEAKLEAGHKCKHYWCVNPRHLEWSTRAENEAAKHEYEAFEDFSDAIDTAIAQIDYKATVVDEVIS